MTRPPWLPLAAAMLAAAIGGSSAVATRVAVAAIDPLTVAALRYGAAAALTLAIAPAPTTRRRGRAT